MLTPELLVAAVGCTKERAELYADHLSFACTIFEIDTPARLSMFLANIGHESGSFRHVTEIWGPTAAQARYEGRKDLGNTRPGDGKKFRGHGLIQTTGRFNHAAVRDRLRAKLGDTVPDFEAEPERLTEPRWAAISAADYWAWKGINVPADAGDFEAVVRKINGGLNGLADRKARLTRAIAALNGVELPKEADMPLAPFIAAALPAIIREIPKLGKIFSSGSEVAERNVQAAEAVVNIVQEATGAKNAQEAAEIIAANPDAKNEAEKAINARWYELTEVGGGIREAREFNAKLAEAPSPYKNPALWVSAALIVMPYMLLLDVFFIHPESYTGEIRVQIVTGVLVIISMIGAYWLGTSFSSSKKDDALMNR